MSSNDNSKKKLISFLSILKELKNVHKRESEHKSETTLSGFQITEIKCSGLSKASPYIHSFTLPYYSDFSV